MKSVYFGRRKKVDGGTESGKGIKDFNVHNYLIKKKRFGKRF